MRLSPHASHPASGFLLLFAVLTLSLSGLVCAGQSAHKVVIQVSSKEQSAQFMALNSSKNLQQLYGREHVTIEVVAYGPGLEILTNKSRYPQEIAELIGRDIIFSACGQTMDRIERETGRRPVLLDDVRVVPGGIQRIIELQEQGYAYIAP